MKFLAIATGKIQTQDSYQTTCDFSYETLTILKFLDNWINVVDEKKKTKLELRKLTGGKLLPLELNFYYQVHR